MDGMQQWYFTEEFTAYDAALLIAGHNPAAHNKVGSSVTREIVRRMEKDYDETHGTYSFDIKGFYPEDSDAGRAARRLELVSVDLKKLINPSPFDNRAAEKLQEWIFSDESGFHNQRFSRDELRRWLAENGLPHVYDFARSVPKGGGTSGDVLLANGAAELDKQVTPKSEGAYLGIIGALCDVYWKLKHPESDKIVLAELLRELDSYRDYPGLGERNLKDKLPKAIKIVRA